MAPRTNLLPLEADILAAGIALRRGNQLRFHGFELARQLRDADGARKLTAHGTLYKALGRLQDAGLLESVWEDPAIAEAEGRPRRRLYEVTGAGQRALAVWVLEQRNTATARPGLEPT
jgi:PadR family transcriptional regulator, regulatory protein PadR